MKSGPSGRSPLVLDAETEHTLKNHVAIVLGYCDLLLAEIPPGDTRHADLLEMHRAAKAVMTLLEREGDE